MNHPKLNIILIIGLVASLNPFTSHAQIIIDGSFESMGAALGNNAMLSTYPTFTSGWTAVDTDGECFRDGNALDGNWYVDLLQNVGGNPVTFWDESTYVFHNYDRILTTITNLNPNSSYKVVFHHSSQLNRFQYLPNQTLVQIQSVQTSDTNSYIFNTPKTKIWEQATVFFKTDSLTTSVYLLFSALGVNYSCVSIDKISISISGKPTGVESLSEESELTISPNPTTNNMTIKNGTGIQTINLYGIAGNLIFHIDDLIAEEFEVSLAQFPKGVYTLVVVDRVGRRGIKKIIKK